MDDTANTMNGTGMPPRTLAEKLARKRELEKEQFQMMKELYSHYRNGTFLSIDIVGSTLLKEGEDSIAVARSFQAFHKFINENLYGSLGSVFSGDGVMVLFERAQEAVNAALRIFRGLDEFNRNESTLRRYINVRIGINSGTVLVDESMELGRLTERNVDIAGHLQKYAEPGQLLISAFTWQQITNQDEFRRRWKTIDNTVVFQYRTNFTPDALLPGAGRIRKRIQNAVGSIFYRFAELRRRVTPRQALFGILGIALAGLLLFLYRGTDGGTASADGPRLVKNRIVRMAGTQHLGDVEYRLDGEWKELPDNVYLVIPRGKNSANNRKRGIKEQTVIPLRRGSDRRFYMVRLGIFDTYVETLNGYRVFLEKDRARAYVNTLK